MAITIAYFTCRREPKIEWFFRSLNRELNGKWNFVNILIIDYWYQYDPEERYADFKKYWDGLAPKESIKHISPKPCPLQGKYKVTKNEYFAASNARNTAFLNCKTDYIVCIDDLTVIKEGWLNAVMWAMKNNFVIYGSYAKVKNLICHEDGSYSYNEFPQGLDSRFNNPHISNDFATRVAGSWLFGCSFGMPLEVALVADGFDETCDGQGAEDYDFGIRIGRITNNIYYSKHMFTYEDEDLHFSTGNLKFLRESKLLTAETKMKMYIGMMSDHAMLQHVLHSGYLPFTPNNLKEKLNCQRDNERSKNNDVEFRSFKNMVDWRDGKRYIDM